MIIYESARELIEQRIDRQYFLTIDYLLKNIESKDVQKYARLLKQAIYATTLEAVKRREV